MVAPPRARAKAQRPPGTYLFLPRPPTGTSVPRKGASLPPSIRPLVGNWPNESIARRRRCGDDCGCDYRAHQCAAAAPPASVSHARTIARLVCHHYLSFELLQLFRTFAVRTSGRRATCAIRVFTPTHAARGLSDGARVCAVLDE